MSEDDTSGTDSGTDDSEQVEPTSHSGGSAKIIGEKDAADDAAVVGHNTATSGTSHGVEGTTDSSESDAAGVHGEATTSDGRTYGLQGVTNSTHSQAAGVRGEAANGAGNAKGVHGKSAGSGFGVYGEARGSGVGVRGNTYSEQTGAIAVEGLVGNTGVENYGVSGESLSTGDGSAGVRGEASATSGVVYGVEGTTSSAEGYGVYSNGDSKTDGNHEVTGSQSIGDLGASVYLGAHQSIPNETSTTVTFDTVNADDRNEFDGTTGVFTCSRDGTYHVDCQVRWKNAFYGEEDVVLSLHAGFDEVANYDETVASTTAGKRPTMSLSKTLWNCSAGEDIRVEVWHNDGSAMDVYGGLDELTYLTIAQIG